MFRHFVFSLGLAVTEFTSPSFLANVQLLGCEIHSDLGIEKKTMETTTGTCRICSCSETISEKLISIYTRDNRSGLVIASMIEEVGGVIVSSKDFRSQEICYECLDKIAIGYAIRQAIQESEKATTQLEEILQHSTNDGAQEAKFVVGKEIKLEQLLEDDFVYEYEYLDEEYLSDDAVKVPLPQESYKIEFVDVTCPNKRKAESPSEKINSQFSKKCNVDRTLQKEYFIMPQSDAILGTVEHNDYLIVNVKGDRCCGCSFVGKNRKELLQHSDSEHAVEMAQNGNYCPICFCKFNSESALNRHIDDCRSTSIYVCKTCERYFNNSHDITMHCLKCHGQKCPRAASDGEGTESQIYDDSENSAIEDSEDENAYGSDSERRGEFLQEYHNSPDKTIGKQYKANLLQQIEDSIKNCDGVPLGYIDETRILQKASFETFEIIRMSGERCCGCKFTCDRREELLIHAKKVHGKNKAVGSGCICPICYQKFCDNKQLAMHINCTTSKYLLICTLCNEIFAGKRSLLYHQEHSKQHQEYCIQSNFDEKTFIELNDPDIDKAVDQELPEIFGKMGNRVRSHNRSITKHRHLNMPDQQFIIHIDDQEHYEVLTVNGERCCGCGQFFETYDDLLHHGRTIHLIENAESLGEYQCDLCFARFGWNKGLLIHKSTRRTVNRLYHCKICNLIFTKQVSVKNHLKQAPNHPTAVVPKEEPTESDSGLIPQKPIILKSTNPSYHCCLPKCPEEFPSEELLLKHCADWHAGKRRENESERTSQQNVCPGCLKAFENRTCLVWHRVNRFNKQYICQFCGLVFTRWPAFREHEDSVHLGKKPEYPCDKCDKVFRTAQRLKTHQDTHSEIKKHVCDVCGIGFRKKGVMKRHRRAVHAIEYPFACQFCPKKTPTQEQLTAHMRVHTGVKPYACRFCERSFSHFTDRKRHEMSTHTGERPHQCPHCPAAYIRNRELVIHMQKHTDMMESVSASA